MNHPKEQSYEIFKTLPSKLQDAILSVENADKLWNIGDKYKLPLNKRGELGDETGLLMLGLVRHEDYVDNLARRLGIDSARALNIANEVNDEILTSVHEFLKWPEQTEQSEEQFTEEESQPEPLSIPKMEDEPEKLIPQPNYDNLVIGIADDGRRYVEEPESHEEILDAIENPHEIKPTPSWVPPMSVYSGLPEIAPEEELVVQPGKIAHNVPPLTRRIPIKPRPGFVPVGFRTPAPPSSTSATAPTPVLSSAPTRIPIKTEPKKPEAPQPSQPQQPLPSTHKTSFIEQKLHAFVSSAKEDEIIEDSPKAAASKPQKDPYREDF